ncbi:Ribonucleoside-diphosphate reductase small subunit [Hondaea fermentalgiana]|uniref:Ribonucleoside-diphosphate reductase small subunit n=1 Tax=Hondaea fermentalgiana TaxID=2315210 RepID=A0A2R5GW12_9STRA|nr:Ribonucleoside-diphosphate reductase small subunit [Hondaea fermentalgiana]|eukprot:GBG35026.1 Ribonucleoside-diphosphate reductase small subunit [Hondaea fermentalgiana]
MERTPVFVNEDAEDRFAILPIKNKDLWDLYKCAVNATWFVHEVTLAGDIIVWNDPSMLNDGERHFIKTVLAFFVGSDKLVADNINSNFIQEVRMMEAEFFYDHQAFIERIHAEVYANMIAAYVPDEVESDHLFRSLETIPVIKRKGMWADRYANADNASFAERLVAFAIFEGVFFSASFASIFYFKKRGLLEGLCTSNDLISRDEALHCRFACLLYSKLIEKLPEDRVHATFEEAVDIECEFVHEALKVDLIGMNASSMSGYVRFIADFWLRELGYMKLFNAKNPFDWMHLISMESKENFFETRVTNYAIGGGATEEENSYGVDDDF